jgi:hypothetical protein
MSQSDDENVTRNPAKPRSTNLYLLSGCNPDVSRPDEIGKSLKKKRAFANTISALLQPRKGEDRRGWRKSSALSGTRPLKVKNSCPNNGILVSLFGTRGARLL